MESDYTSTFVLLWKKSTDTLVFIFCASTEYFSKIYNNCCFFLSLHLFVLCGANVLKSFSHHLTWFKLYIVIKNCNLCRHIIISYLEIFSYQCIGYNNKLYCTCWFWILHKMVYQAYLIWSKTLWRSLLSK